VGSSTSGTGLPTTFVNLSNAGFENGSQGWTATASVIMSAGDEPAHSGIGKAWLGGHDEAHVDRLSRQVTLPATANAIALTYFLHIDTDEPGSKAVDTLRVRVRRSNGQFQTLQTFSNGQAAPGFFVQSVELTQFKGQTIRIEFESKEDNGSQTSFVIDDVAIVVE
jgi:hypothetical protein